jgi:hypothetical protein
MNASMAGNSEPSNSMMGRSLGGSLNNTQNKLYHKMPTSHLSNPESGKRYMAKITKELAYDVLTVK